MFLKLLFLYFIRFNLGHDSIYFVSIFYWYCTIIDNQFNEGIIMANYIYTDIEVLSKVIKTKKSMLNRLEQQGTNNNMINFKIKEIEVLNQKKYNLIFKTI